MYNLNLTKTLGYSVIFHVLVAIVFATIGKYIPKAGNHPLGSKNIMKVEQISPELLKKLRRVGVKGGAKDFSVPVFAQKPKKSKVIMQGSVQKAPNTSEKLSLKDLGKIDPQKIKPNEKNTGQSRVRQKSPSKKAVDMKLRRGALPRKMSRHSQIIKRGVHQNLAQSPAISHILQRKNFNVQFEAPEGVAEDELNSIEKTFYSFQKRTYASYVSAFIESYQTHLKNKPAIKKDLSDGDYLLTGKITFDREGNIVAIKIMKSSLSDHIHSLFEQTLKSVRKLPNPPKDLLSSSEELTIYYQLKIN
jgi:hypothetical protein